MKNACSEKIIIMKYLEFDPDYLQLIQYVNAKKKQPSTTEFC